MACKRQNHSSHDLIEGIQSKRLQPSIHVPYDLIEIVLLRLPVKSLLRFKSVCKQWNATISDHSFPLTHLRQSKSSSNKLFANNRVNKSKKGYTHNKTTQLVEIKYGELRVLPPVYDNPQLEWFEKIVLCHTDGLYLVPKSLITERCYILFNPSNRTYKNLSYPYPHDVRDCNGVERRFGIFYDPLVKDYNVVIGDRLHYAVFHCKTESWSSRKKTNDASSSSGSFNPSFYWVFNYYHGGWGNPSFWKVEILGFDGRDGKFRHVKIPKPDGEQLESPVPMSLGGRLCLLPSCEPMISVMNYGIPIWNIGEVGDEWMKLQLTCSWFRLRPLCWTYRNEIVIHETRSCSILHYDVAERRLTRVRNRSGLNKRFSLVPYVENMFVL